MDITKKRLPDANDELTGPFWSGTRIGELRVQSCSCCGYLRWPPTPLCPECLSDRYEWVPITREGRLISFCVYHRPLDPAFAAEVPYAVGYVQTLEGPRMYGQIDGPVDALTVEGHVRAAFEAITPELTLVKWRPMTGSDVVGDSR